MEYTSCKLIDILNDIHSGGTPSTSESKYWGGNIKWLSSGETGQRFISDTIDKITDEGVQNSSTKLAKKDNIVMACAGQGKTRGQTSYLLADMYINQSVIALEPNEMVLPLYLFYNLSSRYEELRGGSDASSTRGSITTTALKNLSFKYPDLPTQQGIVNILYTYDQLIENNNKRIKLLEQMAENLYKEWFVRFRFPGYETITLEEKRPLGWIVSTCENPKIPSCFEYCEFGEIGSFVRGRNITAAEMIDGEIPVISAGLQPSGYHNQANVKGRSLTISASGANAGYLQYNLTDIWAADCSYYQNDNNLWFVYFTLKFLQPVISNLQCGAAQPHVYPKNINKLCVLKPTDELITKFNEFVEPFFNEIEILKKKNVK